MSNTLNSAQNQKKLRELAIWIECYLRVRRIINIAIPPLLPYDPLADDLDTMEIAETNDKRLEMARLIHEEWPQIEKFIEEELWVLLKAISGNSVQCKAA